LALALYEAREEREEKSEEGRVLVRRYPSHSEACVLQPEKSVKRIPVCEMRRSPVTIPLCNREGVAFSRGRGRLLACVRGDCEASHLSLASLAEESYQWE